MASSQAELTTAPTLPEYPRSAKYDPMWVLENLKPYWNVEFNSFHSPVWWRNHWERNGLVTVEQADRLPDDWTHWLLWEKVCQKHGYPFGLEVITLLQIDAGRNLGFTRISARRNAL